MKKIVFIVTIALFLAGVSCGRNGKKTEDTIVSIKTDFGEIKVKLYEETPLHKNNFVKLVNEEFYYDLLFHRVIKNFMIQGGDPDSKNAQPGARLGGGSPGYTIPAEINPKFFHKRGALAAARRGGPSNPKKESSGSQFYIVHGEVFRMGQLDTMEIQINKKQKDAMLKEHFETANHKFVEFKEKDDRDSFNILVAEIRAKVDSIWETSPKFSLTKEQRETYSTVGGYPSLDGEYSIFGEVVEGMEIVDKIAVVEKDKNNRPLVDIKMKLELVK